MQSVLIPSGQQPELVRLHIPLDQFPLASGAHRLGGYVAVVEQDANAELAMRDLTPFTLTVP